jgi:hypothetical protein
LTLRRASRIVYNERNRTRVYQPIGTTQKRVSGAYRGLRQRISERSGDKIMAILVSLSLEEAQRLRSILQDANEPALLQTIEDELQREKALDELTDISDLSLDELTDIPDISLDGLSLDLETALAALQQAEPDEGISDYRSRGKTSLRGVQSAKRRTKGGAGEMLETLAAEYGLDGIHVRNLGSSLRGVFVQLDSVSVAILNETLDELTDIPDISLDGLSLDLETALEALQQAEPDGGISDYGSR